MKKEEKKKETKKSWEVQGETSISFAKDWNREIIVNGKNPFPSHSYKYEESQSEN